MSYASNFKFEFMVRTYFPHKRQYFMLSTSNKHLHHKSARMVFGNLSRFASTSSANDKTNCSILTFGLTLKFIFCRCGGSATNTGLTRASWCTTTWYVSLVAVAVSAISLTLLLIHCNTYQLFFIHTGEHHTSICMILNYALRSTKYQLHFAVQYRFLGLCTCLCITYIFSFQATCLVFGYLVHHQGGER